MARFFSKKIGRWLAMALPSVVLVFFSQGVVQAISANDFQSITNNTPFYDPNSSGAQCIGASSASSTPPTGAPASSNLDYAGKPILSPAQLTAVKTNEPTYQQAANQVGIPWQILAALHYRETGLGLTNPGNGNGLYQITSKHYAPGPVSPPVFLQESLDAAQFIKSSNPTLSSSPDSAVVKQAFFAYNGQAPQYVQQAVSLGYPASQGYEGSPYVMNYADAKRDPTANPTGWGQIVTDNGPLVYPADSSQMGAFLVYSSLTGATIDGSCATVSCSSSAQTAVGTSGVTANDTAGLSSVRQNVICLAQQELALWQSQPGYPHPAYSETGYYKYSDNVPEEWCADFASWIYNQAGYPFSGGYSGGWRISYVPNIQQLGEQNQHFHWHGAGTGYTPKPGDLAIHGSQHVNIFISSNGNQTLYIGGDQGSGPYPGGSIVSTEITSGYYSDGITGYVSPD